MTRAWSEIFKMNYTHNRAIELYGCSFQAPSCLTQTKTDGTAMIIYDYIIILFW